MSDSQLRRSLAASGMVESDVSESPHEHGADGGQQLGDDVDDGHGAGSGAGEQSIGIDSGGAEACDPFCMDYDFSDYEMDVETGRDMLNGLALVSNLL